MSEPESLKALNLFIKIELEWVFEFMRGPSGDNPRFNIDVDCYKIVTWIQSRNDKTGKGVFCNLQ
jgi:hypothetical protein